MVKNTREDGRRGDTVCNYRYQIDSYTSPNPPMPIKSKMSRVYGWKRGLNSINMKI